MSKNSNILKIPHIWSKAKTRLLNTESIPHRRSSPPDRPRILITFSMTFHLHSHMFMKLYTTRVISNTFSPPTRPRLLYSSHLIFRFFLWLFPSHPQKLPLKYNSVSHPRILIAPLYPLDHDFCLRGLDVLRCCTSRPHVVYFSSLWSLSFLAALKSRDHRFKTSKRNKTMQNMIWFTGYFRFIKKMWLFILLSIFNYLSIYLFIYLFISCTSSLCCCNYAMLAL